MYSILFQYGPCHIKSALTPGQVKLWCACGLSKKQPWCDGSHNGTGISPLRWTVPSKSQALYQLCACKYTKAPPYCDASHVYLPLEVIKRQKECGKNHAEITKLCTSCGKVPEW